MRRVLLFAIKAAITGLLIYFAVRSVSLEAVLERIGDIRVPWLALVLAVLTAQVCLQAFRWLPIVHAAGFPLPATGALRLSFIAAFFGQTLPSTIGGDAVRIWMLAQSYKAGWRIATYSVFVDRAVGVFALAVVVAICLPWTFTFIQDPVGRIAVSLVGLTGVTAGLVFAALSLARNTWIERIWGVHHLIAASGVLRRVATPLSRAAFVAFASLLIHAITIFVAWATAQSIDAAVQFLQMACSDPAGGPARDHTDHHCRLGAAREPDDHSLHARGPECGRRARDLAAARGIQLCRRPDRRSGVADASQGCCSRCVAHGRGTTRPMSGGNRPRCG